MPSAPPHNLEAERALAGAVLIAGPEVWPEVAHVQAADFYLIANQQVWQALADLARAGNGQDFISVSNWLKEHGQLEAVGGPAYLTELLTNVTNAFDAPHHAAIVQAQAHKRVALRLLQSAYNDVAQANGDLPAVAARTAAALDNLSSGRSTSRWVGAAGWEWYAQTKAYAETGALPGLTTGFPRLDRHTHGLKRQQVCILAGRPSMGKSALAFQSNYRQARAGLKVGAFSLEMPDVDVAERIALAECNLDKFNLPADWQARVDPVLETFDTIPFLVCNTPALSPAEIAREAREMRRTLKGLDVLTIDHLGYISHPPGENENIRLGQTMKALVRLAKELDVAVLLLCQLSREVTKRAVKEPDLPDLRESGHIEQDARQVWMLHRDGYYAAIDKQPPRNAPQKAVLLVRKNHNGPRNRGVPFGFIEQSARFQEWDNDDAEPELPYPYRA